MHHGDHRNEARQKILENRNKIILSNRCETNVKRRFARAGLFQSLQRIDKRKMVEKPNRTPIQKEVERPWSPATLVRLPRRHRVAELQTTSQIIS